jgi:polyhydroxybutyrate depolymerase
MKSLLAVSMLIGCLQVWAASGHGTVVTVSVAGQQRTAYLHVPANIDRGKKYPLVIGYHGGAANAQQYIEQSQLFAKGERAGFIVVSPEGTAIGPAGKRRVWNSGSEYARNSRNADDVAFTRQLIDRISSMYPVDPKRIYATGFSNGGQMSYRVALEMSDRIAAIAPMSGGRLAEGSRPSRAVPVLHFHGTADGAYPVKGGLGPISIGRTPHVPIDDVILEWTRFNGARSEARIILNDGSIVSDRFNGYRLES